MTNQINPRGLVSTNLAIENAFFFLLFCHIRAQKGSKGRGEYKYLFSEMPCDISNKTTPSAHYFSELLT